jgi:hypothetical protein
VDIDTKWQTVMLFLTLYSMFVEALKAICQFFMMAELCHNEGITEDKQ